jgi:hypothetical protein
MSTAAVQGIGNPTTWVFAQERSPRGVLEALKAGRTSISFQPPAEGAPVLLLEGDTDGDGVYEAMVGDTVPPRTLLRVRATGLPGAGLVDVRANGKTIIEGAALAPGGTIDFALDEPGWVWAQLYAEDGTATRHETCEPVVGDQTSYCRNRITVLGMTSALYVAEPVVVQPPVGTDPCPAGESPKPRPAAAHPRDDKCRKK